MAQKKQVAIVGGGVSGLTAGIFALKYGFDATIYERNTSVGGLCTGWTRKGTYIDGCIHWLTESDRGVLNKLWHDTGVIKDDTEVYHYDIYSQSVRNGKCVNFYTNADKLEQELLSFATCDNDRRLMRQFVKGVRQCRRNALTVEVPFHVWKFWDKLKFIWKILPLAPVVKKYSKVSVKDMIDELESDDLKYAFANTLVPEDYSLFALMSTFGGIASRNSGTALGGSKAMSERMKETFLALGGKLVLRADVDEIVVENNVAKGLRMKDGEMHKADYVIPACDLHFTLDKLLGKKYRIEALEARDNDKVTNPTYSMIMISYRTKKNLDNVIHNRYVNCKPLQTLGETYDTIYMKHFGYDKNLTDKDGNTVVQAILTTNEEQFDRLQAMSKEEYQQYKKDLAEQMTAKIKEMDPEDTYGELELLDVATPMTFTHYVNAYKGTFMTYMMTKTCKQMILRNNVLPIENLAIAGHWVMVPGGVPIAAMQGKFAAYTLAHKEGLIKR